MVSDAHDTFRLRDGAVRVVVDGVVGEDECDDVGHWLALVQRKFRRLAAPSAQPADPLPPNRAERDDADRTVRVRRPASQQTDDGPLTPIQRLVVERMRGEGPVTIARMVGHGLVYHQIASALSQLRRRGVVTSFDDEDGHRVHELVASAPTAAGQEADDDGE